MRIARGAKPVPDPVHRAVHKSVKKRKKSVNKVVDRTANRRFGEKRTGEKEDGKPPPDFRWRQEVLILKEIEDLLVWESRFFWGA